MRRGSRKERMLAEQGYDGQSPVIYLKIQERYALVFTALAITRIIIGSMAIGHCNIQPYIPIYQVTDGVWQILLHGYFFLRFWIMTRTEGQLEYELFIVDWVLVLLQAVSLSVGCYWVYRVVWTVQLEHSPVSGPNHCQGISYVTGFIYGTGCSVLLVGCVVFGIFKDIRQAMEADL